MPISNQIPPSRLIQPGVVDSAATRPASPFEGQCIFQKDTDQLLVWNGTAWVIPNQTTQNPEGLELITTATCSSGGTASNGIVTIGSGVASVVVGNAFSSTYDNYLIQVSGGSNSIDSVLTLRMDSVSSGYYFQYIYTVFGNNSVVADSSTTANGWTYAGSASTSGLAMSATVLSPNLAKMTRYSSSGNGQGVSYIGHAEGLLNNTTQYTGFTITNTGGGSMTGGTIRVYGYRN